MRVPYVRLLEVNPVCKACSKPCPRFADLCDDCVFYRRVMFQRYRYERGDLTEFPDAMAPLEPAPSSPVGFGSLDDWAPETIERAVG